MCTWNARSKSCTPGRPFADAIIAWLRERGFALRGVYHMAYDGDGRAVQADFLFENRIRNAEKRG